MKFDFVHKLLFGLLSGILLAGIFLGRSWLAAHDDQLRLAATLDAQKTAIAAADQRESQRTAALQTTLDEIAKLKAAVHSPQQAAIAIPKEVNSSLPQPITINLPPQQPGQTAPPDYVASIPEEDLQPIHEAILDCQACKAQLPVVQANLDDEKKKVQALTIERDAAIQASKGGGFWNHVKSATKWLVIGAAAGGVALCATGHCK